MKYVVIKELLPSVTPKNYNRNFFDIPGDAVFAYDTEVEAEQKAEELRNNILYEGRDIKVIIAEDL